MAGGGLEAGVRLNPQEVFLFIHVLEDVPYHAQGVCARSKKKGLGGKPQVLVVQLQLARDPYRESTTIWGPDHSPIVVSDLDVTSSGRRGARQVDAQLTWCRPFCSRLAPAMQAPIPKSYRSSDSSMFDLSAAESAKALLEEGCGWLIVPPIRREARPGTRAFMSDVASTHKAYSSFWKRQGGRKEGRRDQE